MNSEIDQKLAPSSRRGRRIVTSLVGAIGSSAAASSTTRSALARTDVRRAVAEELVNILEEGGDNFARIIIGVAHDRVVDAVEVSLNDSKLRNVAGDAVATAYIVFVDDAPSITIDIQPFADSAFSAIRSVDPLILQILSPQVDPLEISRDARDPNVGEIVDSVRVVTWALLFGGLVLLTTSWFISLAGKWLRLRRVGIRFLFWGIALLVLTYFARNVMFGGDRSSPLSEALVSFAVSRLQTWSIILTAIGFVVTTLGAIMNRRGNKT